MAKFARSMMVSSVAIASVIGLTSDSRAETRDDHCRDLRARLVLEHDRAQRWRFAWAIGFGVAGMGQAIAAQFADDRTKRDVLYMGAAKAALGTGARLVLPVRVPAIADGESCEDLQRDLAVAGRSERIGFWLNHVGGFLVNLGGALVLAHYANWKTGALSFALGYPVGLASTYTMPRWAWHPTISVDDMQTSVGIALAF